MKKLDTLIWDVVSNSDYYVKKVVSDLYNTDAKSQIGNLETELNNLGKQVERVSNEQARLVKLYNSGALDDLGIFTKENLEYKKEKASILKRAEDIKGKINVLKATQDNCDKLTDFVRKIGTRATSYTDAEKQFVLQDIIRNIFVRWDENRQCHDIRVEFKLDAVMEEKQFELKADGTYVYNAPKFNKAQFNAKFNPQRHVLIEKYEKASFTAGDLSKRIVEPLMKP